MRHANSSPKVNAGSMADIAFLLLIFFLVTTTMSFDVGIKRTLPKLCPIDVDCSKNTLKRNVLRIALNRNQKIMIEDKLVRVENIKELVKDFIDNNGDNSCEYCHGNKYNDASENPKKAVISLQNSRDTSYSKFISVQDEISKAYYELRTEYAKNVFKKSIEDLTATELKKMKNAYPFIISETEIH